MEYVFFAEKEKLRYCLFLFYLMINLKIGIYDKDFLCV